MAPGLQPQPQPLAFTAYGLSPCPRPRLGVLQEALAPGSCPPSKALAPGFCPHPLSGVPCFVSSHLSCSPCSVAGYKQNIQRADAIRYVLLHKFGGAYLDIDTTCTVSFDYIISTVNTTRYHAIMAGNNYPAILDPALMLSKQGNPFMEFCMQRLPVMDHNYLLPHLTVFYSTGPYFISLSYLQYPCKDAVYTLDKHLVRHGYFIHEHGSTWTNWDIYIIHFFENYFFKILFVVVLMLLFKKFCT